MRREEQSFIGTIDESHVYTKEINMNLKSMTYSAFLKNISVNLIMELFPEYRWTAKGVNLRLASDWNVHFFRSRLNKVYIYGIKKGRTYWIFGQSTRVTDLCGWLYEECKAS